jgi:hypothetical protein
VPLTVSLHPAAGRVVRRGHGAIGVYLMSEDMLERLDILSCEWAEDGKLIEV